MLPGKTGRRGGRGCCAPQAGQSQAPGVTGQSGPEAAANAPPAPGGATAPSCGRLENSRAGLREEDHGSQPQWALGRVWSQAWARQAVAPGPKAGACRRTAAVQARYTTQVWPGTGGPRGCSGAASAIPRPDPPLSSSSLLQVKKVLLPQKSGVRGKGRSDGQQDCRSHHPGWHGGTHSSASGIQPQACETGHWYT